MNTYVESNFCKAEFGLQYIFAKMSIIYGAGFIRYAADIDPKAIQETWLDILGVYATYRPSIDFALHHMNPQYIPTPLAFRDLCKQAGQIPIKPSTLITRQLTEAEKKRIAVSKAEALSLIAKFTNKVVKK